MQIKLRRLLLLLQYEVLKVQNKLQGWHLHSLFDVSMQFNEFSCGDGFQQRSQEAFSLPEHAGGWPPGWLRMLQLLAGAVRPQSRECRPWMPASALER